MKKYVLWGAVIGCLCIVQLMFSAAEPIKKTAGTNPIVSTLHLRNCSNYIVRVSVGPEYPCIAIHPGFAAEFPTNKVVVIQASSYGRYAPFIRDLFIASGTLCFKTVLDDHPEFRDHDCIIDITLDKDALHFKQGRWKLSVVAPAPFDNTEPADIEAQRNALFVSFKQDHFSTQVARKAAILWSIFPMVAKKMLKKESIHPYNVLGIDRGGEMPTDDQLDNLAHLLITNAKKNFGSSVPATVWEVLKTLIIMSAELIKQKDFDYTLNAGFATMLLRVDDSDNELVQPQDAAEIQAFMHGLREKYKASTGVVEAVDKLASEIKLQESGAVIEAEVTVTPPPPPPLPPVHGTVQENAMSEFLDQFARKEPTKRTLCDNVQFALLQKITEAGDDHKKIDQLKSAAWRRLGILSKQEKSKHNLSRIQDYLSAAMIKSAYNSFNPGDKLNEWISYITQVSPKDARECFKKTEEELKGIRKETLKKNDEIQLMECLKAALAKKFPTPVEDSAPLRAEEFEEL